jgi:serine/threonine protein kinase
MSLRSHEPIPGYTLQERIGVGGYGEVWSAQAPGGLSKAVKLVYGQFDDERATRELKALNRIKEVRHPFLLSLERFEIIDGQLIIVSELADMSLKDRFEQVDATSDARIPREELLGYLRDAADALDYMSDRFSLQHLDVKPENLLLVGGRVKVADFGLVKELHDVTASMMGGLTPIYASPEVFDGQPSQRSDQYSLAIVFQEMLTGVLPFPGKTAAQLATQHVYSRPRLTPLSAGDQAIIARALSKDPSHRFPSCRALIDALSGAAQPAIRQTPSADPRLKTTQEPPNDTTPIRSRAVDTDHDWRRSGSGPGDAAAHSPTMKTLVIGEEPQSTTAEPAAASKPDGRRTGELFPPAAPVEDAIDLGPLELSAKDFALRPTLFLGIGGTATRTLRQLRRQINDRFGAAASLPAVQMLLLDTDARNLYEATQGDCETSLADCETMALPLRNARDYAADSAAKLAWLSRRWLYNIPRSLQTEGRRPLGRLALIDHADRAFDRVRQALVAITNPEAMAVTARAMGLECGPRVPRVFVISSMSGGTGGGMVLDMAYAVRTILADLGLSDEGVCGILTHSTDRNPSAADLATANAYACLSELHHYSACDGYLGEVAARLPRFSVSDGTFPSAYLVHLGDQLDDEQFADATSALASYLYLNAVTPASIAFDMCREQSPAKAERASLRSFGVVRIGSQTTTLPTLAVEQLCGELIDRWRGTARATSAPAAPTSLAEMATQREASADVNPGPNVDHLAVAHATGLGLDYQGLTQHVRALVDAQLGGSSESVLAELRAQVHASLDAQPLEYSQQMLAAIGNVFGPSAAPEPPAKLAPAPIEVALEGWLKQFAEPVGAVVRDWIASLIEAPGARIASAARAKKWYDGHLRGIEAEVAEQLREHQRTLLAIEQALRMVAADHTAQKRSFFGRGGKDAAAQLDPMLAQLVDLRCEQAAARALIRVLRFMMAPIAACGDQIADLTRTLGQINASFVDQSRAVVGAQGPTGLLLVDRVRATIADHLRHRIPDLVGVVDARLQENFFAGEGGLRNVLQHADLKRATLVAAMRGEARGQILAALKQAPIDQAVMASHPDEPSLQGLRECLAEVRPRLNRCGGSQRLVAISPQPMSESALVDALRRVIDPPATIVCDTDADLVLCYEAQGLWIPHVAARLIGDRGDLVHIASRLHTRSDVAWTEMAEASVTASCEEPVHDGGPVALEPAISQR